MFKNTFLVALIILASAETALAQQADPGKDITIPGPPVQVSEEAKRSLELTMGSQSLNAGYSNWRDVTLRGTYAQPRNVLQGEVSVTRRFDEDGAFLGVSDTYTFNDDWFGSVAVGAGDGAFYLPRYRVDAALYKKWLADRSLVTSVGAGYYNAPDGHTDRSLSLGAAYYFTSPWIVEGGVRLNRSSPGSVHTQQKYAAVTYGRDKQDLVSARYTWGGEGYLAIAANTQLVNFKSEEASVAWRHWLNSKTGLLISANRYTNPSYHRSGINIGIFHDF
ncbi:YaiO family outer membrane beta-barrel protein [Polaromonas naphthalenivorans]|uniref:Lipoprotein, putative n=1 Tax=Polaromonas naphthalenivorans (strain CJ2) TaxID=365044 RepID=A1VIY3_POLNA|nr:YaiO family outer membrane beta-barrel protein [Polaromonas naphthalenivorans]ABM35611.1 lipoprotein, putative [Polaromonas naphthalenivorans CJ2]MBH2009507.1 YaiO family outer membrane beta-barrel protein [Xanthomonadaceae bacterium]